jgi:hypothetical protein
VLEGIAVAEDDDVDAVLLAPAVAQLLAAEEGIGRRTPPGHARGLGRRILLGDFLIGRERRGVATALRHGFGAFEEFARPLLGLVGAGALLRHSSRRHQSRAADQDQSGEREPPDGRESVHIDLLVEQVRNALPARPYTSRT